jgi:hypothetical protein
VRVIGVLVSGVRAKAVMIGILLVAASCRGGEDSAREAAIDDVRPQSWTHVEGRCPAAVEGAVFATSGTGCGGDASFDGFQTYLPAILQDVATDAAPCPGIATGQSCYRMWYVGNNDPGDGELRRIGYAVSPDGVAWTRVPGPATDGSILDPGPAGSFDEYGLSSPTVIRDGDVFKMWYVGLGPKNSIQGIGLATSTDGLTWRRVEGPAKGGAVLRESGEDGRFDEHQIITSVVIKDQATEAAPCGAVATGQSCYRMWYEGVDTDDYYRYRIGYATSPDGVAWTKVPGPDPSGAVVGLGPKDGFESKGVGVPNVIKDGALYQMWYEAFNGQRFRIGHVASTDGVHWTRAEPNGPVLAGGDDPGTYKKDDVWTATVLKDGDGYRMWYSVSSKPKSDRLGLASMEPGTSLGDLAATDAAGDLTVGFTTSAAIPAGGSVLVTLAPGVALTGASLGPTSGFGAGATADVEPAVTDGAAQGVARDAVVVRVPQAAPPGPKTMTIRAAPTTGSGSIVVQTFGDLGVLERGTTSLH